MKPIVTFGEVMLRLSAPGPLRLSQASVFERHYGGAEANVAVALAQLGRPAAFVTRLPDNPLADACIAELRGLNVMTEGIVSGGTRIGVYFIEPGAGQRPAVVTYDRAESAIATCSPDDFDWPRLLAGAAALHLTGITPALSATCRAANLAAARTAREAGVLVSVDINYRSKLWSRADAAAAMEALLPLADLCFASEGDTATLFGIAADDYPAMARALRARFPNLKGVAGTLREPFVGTLGALRGALLWDDTAVLSRRHEFAVVDRIGAGDAFAAGVLAGLTQGLVPQECVELGAALGALKHSVAGDYCRIARHEADALIEGDTTGRVQR
jgi:2-dehydro-3-deoxygluconokinase